MARNFAQMFTYKKGNIFLCFNLFVQTAPQKFQS